MFLIAGNPDGPAPIIQTRLLKIKPFNELK
jgi:hypothetical protein